MLKSHRWSGRQIKAVLGVTVLFAGLQTLFLNATPSEPGGRQISSQKRKFAKAQILVQPKANVSDDQLDQAVAVHGGRSKQEIKAIRVHIIEVPEGAEEKVVEALKHNPQIQFAEVDGAVHNSMTLSDPYIGSQWHLNNINAQSAWDLNRGDGIVIAILDSGVNGNHPDLTGKMVPGYNFFDNNTDTSDVQGHGTWVAGTAAASGNNMTGIAGVAWNARIMPVRVSDATGWTYWSTMATALTWAADRGAKVVNMSYAVQESSSVQSAAQYLRSLGGVAVNSAGNTGALDASPASDSLITVSATDASNVMASWSSFGPAVDISAPGTSIYTTNREGGYGYVQGTSFSSPIVAGVVALMMSANPNLSPNEITNLLLSTARDAGPGGWDQNYGRGIVNAAAAVQAAINAAPASPTPPPPIVDTTAPVVKILSPAAGSLLNKASIAVSASATDDVKVVWMAVSIDGSQKATSSTGSISYSINTKKVSTGPHIIRVDAKDAAGNLSSQSIQVSK